MKNKKVVLDAKDLTLKPYTRDWNHFNCPDLYKDKKEEKEK